MPSPLPSPLSAPSQYFPSFLSPNLFIFNRFSRRSSVDEARSKRRVPDDDTKKRRRCIDTGGNTSLSGQRFAFHSFSAFLRAGLTACFVITCVFFMSQFVSKRNMEQGFEPLNIFPIRGSSVGTRRSKKTETSNRRVERLYKFPIPITNRSLLDPGCLAFVARTDFSAAPPPNPHFSISSQFIARRGAAEPNANATEKPNLVPPHFFFMHNYQQNLSTPRLFCSIESAARQNPNHTLTLYTTSIKSLETPQFLHWRNLTNLETRLTLSELNYTEIFSSTPFQPWYSNGTYKKSHWPESNLCNAARLAILHKIGGTYLDMDIISVNPIPNHSMLGYEVDNKYINGAAFSLPAGHAFLDEMMTSFVNDFRGTVWGYNGPGLTTRTYNRVCTDGCGITIQSSDSFYPVHYKERKSLYRNWNESKSCEILGKVVNKSVGVHWWKFLMDQDEKVTKKVATDVLDEATKVKADSAFGVLMRTSCPALFEAYSEKELKIYSNEEELEM